jgi:hypothetical protein
MGGEPRVPDWSVSETWALFQDVAEHWNRSLRETGEVPSEIIRHAFLCAQLVLRAYWRPKNWGKDGRPTESLPRELAHLIANQIGYLVVGKCPAPIAILTGRGQPGIGPHEDKDIALAVAYVKAARRSDIQDRSPVKTICRLYGVDASTARRWQRDRAYVEPEMFWPNATAASRPGLLEQSMRTAALAYRSEGHGRAARLSRLQAEKP